MEVLTFESASGFGTISTIASGKGSACGHSTGLPSVNWGENPLHYNFDLSYYRIRVKKLHEINIEKSQKIFNYCEDKELY